MLGGNKPVVSPVSLTDMSLGAAVQLSPLYTGIFVSSMLFPALASIFKEKIFTEAKQKLGGKQLDLFVVNSFGSGAQAVCVFLLLPFLASLRGIPFNELPSYLAEGMTHQ